MISTFCLAFFCIFVLGWRLWVWVGLGIVYRFAWDTEIGVVFSEQCRYDLLKHTVIDQYTYGMHK